MMHNRRLALSLFLMPMLTAAQQEAVTSATRLSARDRLDESIRFMKLPHEIIPYGVKIKSGWHVGPYIVMGARPYGDSLPAWWKDGIRHAEWRSLAAWFTVYIDAAGHAATNTAVEINGIEAWAYLETTRRWTLIRGQVNSSWQGAYFYEGVAQTPRPNSGRALPDGGFAALPTTAFMVHGGIPQTALPWKEKADLRALLVSVRHRLVLRDEAQADDRDKAGFGVLAGADYYPWVGAKLTDLNSSYNPGAGSGRFLRSKRDWRYSTVLLRVPAVSDEELLQANPPEFLF